MKLKYLGLVLACCFTHVSYAADCSKLVGLWQDENGTSIHIEKVDGGFFSGFLQLSPEIDTFKYRLSGVLNRKADSESTDQAIAFSVNWSFLGSVSSFAGVCEQSSYSSAMKLLTHQVNVSAHAKNERVTTNFSIFKPAIP
jgi:hypothetical protein